ncbi:MAG: hypothetical protein UX88_C0019G0003 [Candidatus Woesebacteria bacterium GW2011_GWC2_47_16]|uniref:Uncharacterized protein n=4 Tax=Candidatus Woeseibacteriota TaxID=1752722 RepID=A0A0G1S3N3_9BACT|nr:MAG: hypothetical protein UX34_C0027G0004 [Candidatus Woesebacteria bacterium GW2011_GWF1_46_13]KKU63992.1 MAG: hypothetical protein UX88_C0019G0003 [Candidatus Woesebacteria bacterium GW2011_GWC2_47_16]OGM85072.1 MAG: hypothetical protein A2435_02075 [Candidatus Woesebacteria bacterium RIFOXYC1_FULL_46_16]OGM89338.1 MAG: hypothetical protein A2597_01725 [Candidatus Woesebacteria bacterium RIFOXYD1_FULL_46_19]
MRREARLKEVKLRKNLLPTLAVTLILWGLLAGLIFFVEPDSVPAIPIFFLLVFLAFLFSFSLLFAHTRRGLVAAGAAALFLILRYLGVGNVLNLFLIAGLAVTAELYFSKNR